MAQRLILRMGDPRLLEHAKPIDLASIQSPEIQTVIADLFDTMRAHDGAGLAAPQIGVPLQLVIFGFTHNARYPEAPPIPQTVLINPVITPLGNDKSTGWEGCLSVPGMRGMVPRWQRIRYQGLDQNGDPIDRTVADFHARVVQHECDHLHGTLFPMRIRDFAQFGFTEELRAKQAT